MQFKQGTFRNIFTSVADPDPNPDPNPDPHVFGPIGSGSGTISQRSGMDPDPSITKQKRKKNLHSYCFVTSF
jgi:hypothetical protein